MTGERAPGAPTPAGDDGGAESAGGGRSRSRPSPAERAALFETLLRDHGVHVHRWRTSMSGIAWLGPGPDGPLTRWIEAPRPRRSMSCAIFLHEVGHHALGLGRFRPRCLEEYHAWRWSLRAMRRHGLPIDERVLRRVARSLHYAVGKAARRGMRLLPAPLLTFVDPSSADAHGWLESFLADRGEAAAPCGPAAHPTRPERRPRCSPPPGSDAP